VGAPSTDTASSTGSRGILIFDAHSNSATVNMSGSGALAFSGAIYAHSSPSYNGQISLSGSSGTDTFVLGEIVADAIAITGNGGITMALNPNPSVDLLKVSILQ
jgi:hypothetical protein